MYEEVRKENEELINSYPQLKETFSTENLHREIKQIQVYAQLSERQLNYQTRLQDKNELVPAFLLIRGLVKQHIDSFNYLIEHDLYNIIMAKNNNVVLSDSDPTFYLKYLCSFNDNNNVHHSLLRYTGINVENPKSKINYEERLLLPHECRISNLTYSAQIT